LGFIAVRSAFCTPVCMTMFLEKPLNNESQIDKHLLMDSDPRWQDPATIYSVRIAATRLDARIDRLILTLEHEIARLESKIK
jgi:hypothetical protein